MSVGTPENVLSLLEQGKTVGFVMDYTSWPRRNILTVATRAGLLHNPETDTVSRQHLDEEDEDRPQDLRRPDPVHPAPPSPPPGRCSHALLLDWAAQHGDSTARAAAARVQLALEVIAGRQKVARAKADERRRREEAKAQAAREREQARAEVARLQAELAAARARVQGKTHNAKGIRAWARSAGVDCPAFGRVPSAVVLAYEAAHQSGAA